VETDASTEGADGAADADADADDGGGATFFALSSEAPSGNVRVNSGASAWLFATTTTCRSYEPGSGAAGSSSGTVTDALYDEPDEEPRAVRLFERTTLPVVLERASSTTLSA
jgi:hypothetical protein